MQQQQSAEFSHKLTKWQNEPTLQALKSDLEQATQAHGAQITKIKRWNDLLKVDGSEKPKKVKGRSSVQPKLIRRQAEWRYSALTEPFLGSEKLFKIEPVTHEDDKAAKQNELLLNWQFRTKLNRVKLVDDIVRSDVDEGSCILRTGWKRHTVKLKKMVPVFQYREMANEQEIQMLQQALALRTEDPRTYTETVSPELQAAVDYYDENQVATVATQVREEEVEYDHLMENHPIVDVMNPENVFIDPSCQGDMDKALFVVVSFETNKADLLKEGKRYKNLDKINWEDGTPLNHPTHVSSTPDTFQFQDKNRKKVVAYEYWGFWDIEGDDRLVPFVATWIGDVLIRMELNPFPDEKLPFVLIPYLPVKRELYGEPDAELLEDNQKILGAVTRGMIDLLGRSANGQQGFAKGMLDPLNRRRFENGQDYEFNPNMPVAQGHMEHKYPEFPQSALAMLNLQNQEAEALTGVKSFGGGISGEAYGDVAAGIRGVLDAASKREMAILRRLSKGFQDVGNKIIAMNAVFLSEEEVVRVTNGEFEQIRREDLKGNFDLQIDISTAEVDEKKSQDLAFMLQTMGNTLPMEFTMMILAEIARLKKMPALAHQIKTFKPEPDPMAEQMKQLQLEEQQLKNAEIQSKIDLNMAKAKQAEAAADKANLDFVEQETGTAHERDMEKQRGQSQGNQNLEITKALTKPRKEGEKSPDIEAAVGFNELTNGKDRISSTNPEPSVDNFLQRDELAEEYPRLSIGSRFFDPALDPALNPDMNI